MCIVIDPGSIPIVFSSANARHAEFSPILEWITAGKGVMIIGGTKYGIELAHLGKFLNLLNELRIAGKLVRLPTKEVDALCRRLKTLVPDSRFNDEHLVALVVLSRCSLVCTTDAEACPFIKMKRLYPKGFVRPRIYSRKRHRSLLVDAKISPTCQA